MQNFQPEKQKLHEYSSTRPSIPTNTNQIWDPTKNQTSPTSSVSVSTAEWDCGGDPSCSFSSSRSGVGASSTSFSSSELGAAAVSGPRSAFSINSRALLQFSRTTSRARLLTRTCSTSAAASRGRGGMGEGAAGAGEMPASIMPYKKEWPTRAERDGIESIGLGGIGQWRAVLSSSCFSFACIYLWAPLNNFS